MFVRVAPERERERELKKSGLFENGMGFAGARSTWIFLMN